MRKKTIEEQVYDNLIAMKPGEVLRVEDVAKKNPALFIEIVKQCIDIKAPVEFNKDYSTIKRLDLFNLVDRLEKDIIDYGRDYVEQKEN